jgi:hypothetical protein
VHKVPLVFIIDLMSLKVLAIKKSGPHDADDDDRPGFHTVQPSACALEFQRIFLLKSRARSSETPADTCSEPRTITSQSLLRLH